MSADNWTFCPACKKKNDAANAKRLADVEKIYGKVSAQEYRARHKAALRPIVLGESLREDYDIGTDEDGVFSVSYSCSCQTCKFDHIFKTGETQLSID